jgi:hypothetical protein
MLRTLCRAAGWLLLAAIITATVSPLRLRPESGFDPGLERAGAFFALGLLFAIGYRRHWLLMLCGVIGAAFAIESLQFLTPDRHAAIADAAVKAIGGSAGILAGRAPIQRSLTKRWGRLFESAL